MSQSLSRFAGLALVGAACFGLLLLVLLVWIAKLTLDARRAEKRAARHDALFLYLAHGARAPGRRRTRGRIPPGRGEHAPAVP